MPHATGEKNGQVEAEEDDRLIARMLNNEEGTIEIPVLEAGEKADDAIDYEDISDDDLPEEESASGNIVEDLKNGASGDSNNLISGLEGLEAFTNTQDVDLFGEHEDDGLADLFGDIPSDPVGTQAIDLENGITALPTTSKPLVLPGDISLDLTDTPDVLEETIEQPQFQEVIYNEQEDEAI